MERIINKIKKYFEQTPITAEQAKMLQQTGKIITIEEILSKFISHLDIQILNRSRFGHSHVSIEIPFYLKSKIIEINDIYVNRNFQTTFLYDSILIIKW